MFRLLLAKGTTARRADVKMARCCYNRYLSSSTPRRGSWASLSDSQRDAWKVLGWDEEKWNNHGRSLPTSSFNVWSKLSADEKAAAKHGLGYTPEEWDSLISKSDSGDNDRFNVTVRKDKGELSRARTPPPKSVPVDFDTLGTKSNSTKDNTQSVASSLAQAAWNVAKAVAPSATNTLSEQMAPPVVVNDVETTVYLDDSPSMNENTGGWFSFTPSRLEQGRKVLSSLAPKLGSLPCRVLKFSNKPTVLSMRKEKGGGIKSSLPAITSGWDGSGNGTYLWKMIEEDVMERYRPGKGKLRLVVVTDGEDNMSPWNYQGMAGMDPMMRTLQQAGYDIEWHIIVIGGERGLERYKALAGATGGSFLAIDNEFDERSREATSLLKAIESSTDEHGRRERQRRYEKDRDAGKVDKVDWYKKLPPPDKK